MLELYGTKGYSDISKFPFTAQRDPRLKKDKLYYIQKCESIYAHHVNNLTSIPYSYQTDIGELRAFADGNQPESRYRRFIKQITKDPTVQAQGVRIDRAEAEKKGYYNILWDVVSPAPKICNTLVGLFETKEYNISANPIDLHSRNEMEDAEMELWAIADNKDFLALYNKAAGLKNNEPDFIPESQEEMEVYKDMGGFKPSYARAMEKAIKHTRNISYWNEVKKKMARDKVVLNIEACQDYYDPEDNMIKTRYVDPANLIIQYSEHSDHHDSEFAGYVYTMNVSEVRQWIPGRPEEWYRDLAIQYGGYYGNPTLAKTTEVWSGNGSCLYDAYKVLVASFEWIDVDSKKKISWRNKWKKDIVKDVDYDTELKEFMPQVKTEDKVMSFTDKRMRFEAKWLVGTSEVFDWGPSYDVTRPSKRDVSLTYHVYKYEGKSLMKQIIPMLDQFQILWLKLQNALAYARNSGGLYNATAIASVAKTPDEQRAWFRRFLESGSEMFAETNAMTMRNNSMMPFYPTEGGMGKMLDNIVFLYQFNAKMIEETTGLNPISLGATPEKEVPVTTMQMAMNSLSNTLKPLVSGYMTLQTQWAENITRWIQISVRNNKDAQRAYEGALGQFDVQVLKTAEGNSVQYGISLDPLPDDQQKLELYKQIQIGQTVNGEGYARLSASDAIALTHMINANYSLRQIEFEFRFRERRNMREFQKASAERVAIQNQAVMEQQQAAQKSAMDLETMKHGNAMAQIQEQNKGGVAKVATGETIKKDKEVEVANIKQSQPKPEKVVAT